MPFVTYCHFPNKYFLNVEPGKESIVSVKQFYTTLKNEVYALLSVNEKMPSQEKHYYVKYYGKGINHISYVTIYQKRDLTLHHYWNPNCLELHLSFCIPK